MSNKKVYRAWSMYDWANSAYNLVITSTIFPAYYTAITTVKENDVVISDQVRFFGISISNSSLFDFAVATAYLIIALISPILSSIADVRGSKKGFMRAFCYLGAVACAGMYFFTDKNLEFGMIMFVLAAIGYCGSLVFYNSYLPQIAMEQDRDKLSAQGFAYGYVGSVILQLICFVFVLKPGWFGILDSTFAPRLSFLLVGVWWFAFAHIPFAILPKGVPARKESNGSILRNGFLELKKVWNQVRRLPVLKLFLSAFFLYSMGVQTVMLAATLFGSKVLRLADEQLIATILIIQLVAVGGALLMSRLSVLFGNLRVLAATVVIWIGVCIGAYLTTEAWQFYILAAVVGLIMGGIQALSRSTYSKMMPETKDTTSFFSFYDVTEKIAIVIGMFSFGVIDHQTGNMRNSILVLVLFFLAGLALLFAARRAEIRIQSENVSSE